MSTLRKSLKRPETYLIFMLLLVVFAAADSYRSPANQMTARLYIKGIRFYQVVGGPLLQGRIRCRYLPTCSNYSIEAVQKHGIRHGVVLTYKRISSCQRTVPPGTLDPVPGSSQ